MCGIFGWVGKLTVRERVALASSLSVANITRGKDSWGFVFADKGRWGVSRGLGPASRAAHAMSLCPSAVAGHARYATSGLVNVENAHPFERGQIMLAHNGVIFNHARISEEHEVDSELLASRIAAGHPLSDLDGYGAVWWVDKSRPGKVYLSHIGGGDLSAAAVLGSRGTRGVVWSSDSAHLKQALDCASLDWSMLALAEGQVYEVSASGAAATTLRLSWKHVEKFKPKQGGLFGGRSSRKRSPAWNFDLDANDFDNDESWLRWLEKYDQDELLEGKGQ